MYTVRKLTLCIGILTLLLAWSCVSEGQVNKRYGRATRNKFIQLNPYKIGKINYRRPYSYLEGRNWRLKMLIPHADTTRYNESATGRKWKYLGYDSKTTPYSVYLSYKWLGIGATSMSYKLKSDNFDYRFAMEWQDAGLTFGLQKRFLMRKGRRKFGGVSSVYRSNLTLGVGRATRGTAQMEYLGTTFSSEIQKGNAWFIIYGWEIYEGESFSIEAAAAYRENSVQYDPPSAVINGTKFTTSDPLEGSITQYLIGFGVSF